MPLAASVVCGVLSLVGIGLNLTDGGVGHGLVKALPALFLAGCAWRFTTPRFGYWMVAAAVLGAAGDFSLSGADRDWFMPGLVAFLIGHVAYCAAFAKDLRWSRGGGIVIGVTLAFTGAMLAAVCIRFVRAGEYGLIAPVIVYVAIMGIMMTLAVLHQSGTLLIAAGGVVFIVSDAHIAVNHMLLDAPLLPITLSGYTTYYLAQYLLVAGAVHEARDTNRQILGAA